MKFGTFHLMERPFWKSEPQVVAEHLDQMRAADELGFDAVWLTEHHFSSVPYVPQVPGEYGISASPFALACAVSQITRRVRIGTAVKVLALEHPLRTAEDAALADILSLGRLDFGVGFGYRQYEFDGFGVPVAEKSERFKEALEIIVGAWTNREVSYTGRFHHIPRLSLIPRPCRRPPPHGRDVRRLGARGRARDARDQRVHGEEPLRAALGMGTPARARRDARGVHRGHGRARKSRCAVRFPLHPSHLRGGDGRGRAARRPRGRRVLHE